LLILVGKGGSPSDLAHRVPDHCKRTRRRRNLSPLSTHRTSLVGRVKRYYIMADGPTVSLQSDGLQPGHDIFCTPNNDAFHASSLYSELDVAQQEVRLVKLWPGTGDDVIECTLLPGAPLLDLKGRYTAPSYCAGSAKNTEPIVLNGTAFNVFANLAHALREVRQFWSTTYGDRECLLWVDQISINQYDIDERSSQVRFMREIYQYAEQVLVCLSTGKADPQGMNWSIKIARDVRPRGFDEIPIDDITRAKRGTGISASNDDMDDKQRAEMIDNNHQSLIADYVCENLGNLEFMKGWSASFEIFEAPWLTRAWVLQEFIVAADVYFMYSGVFASWQAILPVWRAIYSTFRLRILQTAGGFRRQLPRISEQRDRHRLGNTQQGGLMVSMEEAIFTIDSKAHSLQNQDFKELLSHSRNRDTSDPRDKIFAYIGLINPAYGIVPNYSHPIDQVLINTTIKIIETENSLDILWHAAASEIQHTTNLPSWVADWRCKQDPLASEKLYDNALKQTEANASFHTVETARGTLQALEVDGVLIDRLDKGSERLRSDERLYISCKSFVLSCSHSSHKDDEIWVLRGCRSPLILRPQDKYGYILVSVASYWQSCSTDPCGEIWIMERAQDKREKQGGWRSISII